MSLKEIIYNIYSYVYLIVIVVSIIAYGLNFGDYKEDSKFCANQYNYLMDDYELYYWKQKDLCCHYTLNQDNNIIEECKLIDAKS